jgi:hypothetical protein
MKEVLKGLVIFMAAFPISAALPVSDVFFLQSHIAHQARQADAFSCFRAA